MKMILFYSTSSLYKIKHDRYFIFLALFLEEKVIHDVLACVDKTFHYI